MRDTLLALEDRLAQGQERRGPLDELLDRFYTADVFMHSWDLGRSNGITPELDQSFAAGLHTGLASMGEMLQQSGQFGQPLGRRVAGDDDRAQRTLHQIGRAHV